jgi:hypothetical protein
MGKLHFTPMKLTQIRNFGTNVSIASIATYKVEKIFKLPDEC